MDEAAIRKRCEEILSGAPITSDELVVYRAAVADGQRDEMERAAKIADGLRHENGDYIAEQIRLTAGGCGRTAMTDAQSRRFGPCERCLHPICVCPKHDARREPVLDEVRSVLQVIVGTLNTIAAEQSISVEVDKGSGKCTKRTGRGINLVCC